MVEESRRGRLTVYLGAAPGVGKTYAMLGEAKRRCERGTDVVIGYVETHGRAHTEEQLAGLEVIPRRTIRHRGADFTEMDTDAIIARQPAVVCVDELAHTNVPGSARPKRAEDVEAIRAAGIDVITTINIQHLESLNDEVERITGVRQRETVPDDVVRTADQIQLVDMSPEALRRRMAHGNIYKAENVDASLTSYFRVGNLTALRELALLWLADRVDDALGDYRRAHQIEQTWPTKERIVVAVTGGPESETLMRRGARLAQRAAGSELLAVHVIATDGLHSPDGRRIARAQQLVAALGGTFHSVVGEDVSAAVVDFAAGANATMIVVGVSRHGRLRRLFTGTTGDRIASLAGAVDVHLVTHDQVARTVRRRRQVSSLSRTRQLLGWMCAMALPLLLTAVLSPLAGPDQLALAEVLFLGAAVVVALVGGLLPALVGSVWGFLLLNWFFTPPTGELTVSEPENVIALLVYVAVAAAVASVVDRASRRAAEATRARTEAATMSALSRSVLTGQDTAEAIVARLRETFGQDAVALLAKDPAGWRVVASTGDPCAKTPDEGDTRVRVDEEHVLALCGAPLRADDQRVLEAFAVQTSLVLEYRRLKDREQRAAALESAEATSTAVLRAVSHDLRTPLATARTAVEVLIASNTGNELGADDQRELLSAVATSTEQLERLIDNLLDLSRLQTGLLKPQLRPHSLDEVLPLVVAAHPDEAVALEVDESVPMICTDPGLLDRVLANLVGNAVRVSAGTPVRIQAHVLASTIEIMIVDRGPGVPPQRREQMFDPFQRLGDTTPGGLGLGLAVARGLAEALDATLTAEDTPGGGLTMVLALPRHQNTDAPTEAPIDTPSHPRRSTDGTDQ